MLAKLTVLHRQIMSSLAIAAIAKAILLRTSAEQEPSSHRVGPRYLKLITSSHFICIDVATEQLPYSTTFEERGEPRWIRTGIPLLGPDECLATKPDKRTTSPEKNREDDSINLSNP